MHRYPAHRSRQSASAHARAGGFAASPDASHADRIAALDELLTAGVSDAAMAGGLEATVRALAANRRALLPFRAVAPTLTATIKDPWSTRSPDVALAALLDSLPAADTISVRLDPQIAAEVHTDGPIGRATRDGVCLRFVRGRRVSATLTGPPERLELLESLVRPQTPGGDLERVALPRTRRRSGSSQMRDVGRSTSCWRRAGNWSSAPSGSSAGSPP